jgi:hypothetical protein
VILASCLKRLSKTGAYEKKKKHRVKVCLSIQRSWSSAYFLSRAFVRVRNNRKLSPYPLGVENVAAI